MRVMRINPNDNVAVAIEPVFSTQEFTVGSARFTALNDIYQGHKVALADIPAGGKIIKYGSTIGYAADDIKTGEHVHLHNVKTGLNERGRYIYEPVRPLKQTVADGNFMGFRRGNGKVGIRNEIWIIPTVCCTNAIGEIVARKARDMLRGTLTGVYCFPHQCGCSQLGDDHENTKKALRGLIKHPNAAGVLVLGLGCENNNIGELRGFLGKYDESRVKFLNCQDRDDEITAALNLVNDLIRTAGNDAREPVPVSELVIGLKCGGSDGLSGITANPLIGAVSDSVIMRGGSSILTEVPEMFGAETLLMNRCVNEAVFEKTVALIRNFKAYFTEYGQPVYENPSPGNKAGGITTLEDKSLGCTQKSGSAGIADVISYGEPVTEKGLNLLQSPGNDMVATTALTASGAHLILFSTGLGTPVGAPVPTVKVSSGTPLYTKKKNWIDFDAGRLISDESFDALADELYDYIISVASGEAYTKSEQQGIREIVLFKTGVTL